MSESADYFERGKISSELTEFVEMEEFSDYETSEMRSLYHAGNSMVRLLLREFVDSQNSTGHPFELSYGFLAQQSFGADLFLNGAAGRRRQTYCAALDGGLVPCIQDLADSLLSQPNVLPEVGDAKREQRQVVHVAETEPGLRAYLARNASAEVQQRLAEIRFYPICDIRQECAQELGVMMLALTWFHEIAHAVNGHVDLCAQSGINRLRERGLGENLSPARIDRLSLEIEADFYAMLMALLMIRKYRNPFGAIIGMSHLARLPYEKQASLVMVATTCLCHLWDRLHIIDSKFNVEAEPDHPTPRRRAHYVQFGFQLAMTATSSPDVRNASKEAIEAAIKTSQHALQSALESLSAYAKDIQQERYDPRGEWNFSGESIHLSDIEHKLIKLRTETHPYRFVKSKAYQRKLV